MVDIAVGDLVVTEDGAQWRVHSIARDGARQSVVALLLSGPTVLAIDVSRLRWSESDGAWRLTDPGGGLPRAQR